MHRERIGAGRKLVHRNPGLEEIVCPAQPLLQRVHRRTNALRARVLRDSFERFREQRFGGNAAFLGDGELFGHHAAGGGITNGSETRFLLRGQARAGERDEQCPRSHPEKRGARAGRDHGAFTIRTDASPPKSRSRVRGARGSMASFPSTMKA